jgi:hypothetical protein
VHVHAPGFGFSFRGHNIFYCFAEGVDWSVGCWVGFVRCWSGSVAEKIVPSITASGLGEDEVGGVGLDMEYHAAGVVLDGCCWVGVKVIHQHFGFCFGVRGGSCLLGGVFDECWEDGWVDAACVVEEGAGSGLDALSSFLLRRGAVEAGVGTGGECADRSLVRPICVVHVGAFWEKCGAIFFRV